MGSVCFTSKLCSIRREDRVVYTNDSGLAAWLEVDGQNVFACLQYSAFFLFQQEIRAVQQSISLEKRIVNKNCQLHFFQLSHTGVELQ